MKSIRKRIIIKMIAFVTALLVIMQTVPAFAVFDETKKQIESESESLSAESITANDSKKIVCELKEKRDEYSKEYLLKDGSFSKVIYDSPIHYLQNEKWKDIDQMRGSDTRGDLNANSSFSFYEEYNSDSLKPLGNQTNRWKIKSSDGAINIITGYFPDPKYAITSVTLKFNCNKSGADLTYRKRTDSNSITALTVGNYPVIASSVSIQTATNNPAPLNVLDLTDIYKRWIDGAEPNYGIILQSESSNDIIVHTFELTINYKNVDANDSSYTYHTIDMDSSGTGYINQYNEYFHYEQSIMPLDSLLLPKELTRLYNVRPVETANAGLGFHWNVESTIEVAEEAAFWDTFTGEIKTFVPDETPVIENGYQVWRENGYIGETDNTTVLLYLLNSAYTNYELTPEDVYIRQGNTFYYFNEDGYLVTISKENSSGNPYEANIIYNSSDEIIRLETETGIKYDFSYDDNNDYSVDFISSITIRDADNNQVTELDANNNVVNSGATFIMESTLDDTYLNRLLRNNMPEVVAESDPDCALLSVKDNSSKWEFDYYTNTEYLGKRISGYTKYDIDSLGMETEDYSVVFENLGAYYRKTSKCEGTAIIFTEEMQFDRENRLTSLRDSTGKYLSFEYYGDNQSSAYVFNSQSGNIIYTQGFEESTPLSSMSCSSDVSVTSSTWLDTGHGDYEVIVEPNINTQQYLSKTVTGSFTADMTYAVGAWIKTTSTAPSSNYQIELEAYPTNNYPASVILDNCLNNEWQYVMVPFKLIADTTQLTISVYVDNPAGDVRIDEICLIESADTSTDLDYLDTSSAIEFEYDENDNIIKEIITDGVIAINRSYTYDEYGDVDSITDEDGLTVYYEGSTYVKRFGSQRDNSGNIVDATEMHYSGTGVLQSINQIVSGLSASTVYTTIGNQIVSITHNGFEYQYDYDNSGKLEKIKRVKNNQTADMVEYDYLNTGWIGNIIFSNNTEIEYYYDNTGLITEIKYLKNDPVTNSTTAFKDFQYTYNQSGNLTSVSDSVSGDELSYTGNGYSFIVNNTTLYTKSVDSYQNTFNSYKQSRYLQQGQTTSDIMAVGPTETTYDSSDGSTEKSNSIQVLKNTSEGDLSRIDFDTSGTYDYFNRLNNVDISFEYRKQIGNNSNVVTGDISRQYTYKDVSEGVSSYLVSSYSSSVPGTQGANTYSRKYEYDNRGNLVFAYVLDANNAVTMKEYYEYDAANQLVTEINRDKGIVAKYTYNSAGNITSKKYYDIAGLNFNDENREIVSLGDTINKEITFNYSNFWKDQLSGIQSTNIPNYSISYDNYGNPLNYFGFDFMNSLVNGDLEWNGDKLAVFEKSNQRIEFEYNDKGNLSKKTVYYKSVTGQEATYILLDTYRYLWDNDKLEGVIYKTAGAPEQSIMIIYDQGGSAVGYVDYRGIMLFYQKDLYGNVIGLVFPNGQRFADIYFDSWGEITGQGYEYYWDDVHLSALAAMAAATYSPVTFNGMIYIPEMGLYCDKGRFYSPTWGRYLNPDSPKNIGLNDSSVLDANLYLFHNNDPVNEYFDWNKLDIVGEITGWNAYGFNVAMSRDFASRAVCALFADDFIRKYGSWTPQDGYSYNGMCSLRIASNLFAACIAKYSRAAIDCVNASWGDGWSLDCLQSNVIQIRNNDPNAWKYQRIWEAAEYIKHHSNSISITL